MDAPRFDQLVRLVGERTPRRGVLGVFVALTSFAAGAIQSQRHLRQGGMDAQAATCRTLNQSCTRKRPKIGKRRKCCAGLVCREKSCRIKECSSFLGCGEGRGCCDGVCVDMQNDPQNCGQCGKACGGNPCLGGRCLSPCVAGLTECNGACVDILRDPRHCGGCQTNCGERDPTCQDGSCTCREVGEVCQSTQESISCCGAERGWATCAAVEARKLNQYDCDIAETGLQCCLFDGQPCFDHCDCCGSSYCRSQTGVCTSENFPPPDRCIDLGGQCPGYGSDDCCGYPDVLCCAFGSCSKSYQGVGFCRRDCRQSGEACTDDPLGGTANHCCANLYCVNRVCRTRPCGPFGVACESASDCCDGVPCSGGLCRYD